MTKRKAEALASVELDRHLLTDEAARDRVLDAEPQEDRDALKRYSQGREYLDFRMRHG